MLPIVTPFPFFLDYALFAPLLLRLALGVYILALGFSAQHKTSNAENPELTSLQMTFRFLILAAGISLIIGLYTQISAIVVIALMIVSIADKRFRLTTELNRAELSLLLIISLSLLVTGAGPFAFDLPL